MAIEWHYRREDLTDQFLDTFDAASSSALTLFAPRRMGKTEFVLYDLIPTAQKRGYLPIYVSFWEYTKDPVRCLQIGLDRANSSLSWSSRLRSSGMTPQDFQLGLGGITAGVGLHRAAETIPPSDNQLLELSQAFDRFLQTGKPVLLCLDEVQHLASDVAFESLVYFLRTVIDKHRETLKVVYTGSSRDGLQRLFRRRKAPLFQSTSQIDLPELGAGFVRHLLAAFSDATGRHLSFNDALSAFKAVKKVPFELRQIIDLMIRSGVTDIKQVTNEYLNANIDSSGFKEAWEALKPLDQAILLRLLQDGRGLYSDDSRTFIADYLGLAEEDITTYRVQNSVNRMRGFLISPIERGMWDFEDAQFKDWVLDHHGHS